MAKYKCAVFDLDGTLVNTIDDLANACNTLLERYGYPAQWTEADYKRFVGNGAKLLVSRAFGNTLDEATLDERFAEFKVIYDKTKLDNAYIYDGIQEQLDALKAQGIKLCVVTNKPHEAAVGMLDYLFGENYFDAIHGVKDGVPTKPHPAGALNALKEVGCTANESLYFGDSNVDMQTAKNANIKAIGVLWGFRTKEELLAEQPFALLESPCDIGKLF